MPTGAAAGMVARMGSGEAFQTTVVRRLPRSMTTRLTWPGQRNWVRPRFEASNA
jgi:hypothetical protein